MQKQQLMELRTVEQIFTPSIEMRLELIQEILQKLSSMHSFTGQEMLNLVAFLEGVLRKERRLERTSYLESAVLWILPIELSRYTEDVGISLVWTEGNYTFDQNMLLSIPCFSQLEQYS